MKLQDISNGPDWLVWIVFAIFVVLSIVLLSGHGSWLVAGYNMASKKEKDKYDEKKLCRATGTGMAVISVLVLFTKLFEKILPASFAIVLVVIILIDCLAVIIACNTICKK